MDIGHSVMLQDFDLDVRIRTSAGGWGSRSRGVCVGGIYREGRA